MNKPTATLLEQHFDTAFNAPDGIKKLRELILTLAMQGKLVPQDPKDPPATALLKEIEAEKKRLVNEGKIKAPKPLPPVAEGEKPYALPQGWEWVRLSAIGNIFNGNSINASEKESKYSGVEGLPYIATKDVGYGFDPLEYDNGICIPLDEEKFRIGHQGAVLICAEGGSAGKKCGLTDRDICFGNKLFANELYGQIPSRFVLYVYLSSAFRASFTAAMTGIIGGVSIAKFVEIPIPLPPLDEQLRIVAKVDKLMAQCDALENLRNERENKRLATHTAALSQLSETTGKSSAGDAWVFITQHFGDLYSVKENVTELRKAILQLAVRGRLSDQNDKDGSATETLAKVAAERRRLKIQESPNPIRDPKPLGYEIPGNWEWRCLGDLLVSGPTNGFSPRAVDYETPVRSLTLSATTSGVFKGEHAKFIADEISPDSDLWLRDGDILVQRGNTLEYVGVPAIYRGESNCYIYPDLMMRLRVSSELDTDFLYFAMSSEPGRNFLRERASGTSGTMPKINQKTLMSLPIPIPPIQEQHRIVAKINRLMSLCNTLDEKIDAAANQQTALLNALMVQM
ncbi:MAG: restriction endonuclease subunit S [Burkholderiales bacterium]|jgi:type I restriction enzyme S subunit